MQLPADFITQMERMMAPELWHVLREGLAQEPSVSIRINPSKIDLKEWEVVFSDGVVPWCEYGFYLTHRPPFTFDPLLHAGAYYVQESSSMFLHHVLRQYVTEPVAMLDLCAAPGGKSTLARSVLPEGSRLVSNEMGIPQSHRDKPLSQGLPQKERTLRRHPYRCSLLRRGNVPQGRRGNSRVESAESGAMSALATRDSQRCVGMSRPGRTAHL